MNNRICPQEELLSEYLSGTLTEEESAKLQNHLLVCSQCRELVSEAYELLNKPGFFTIKDTIFPWFRKNKWLTGCAITLIFSFLLPKYFLQFLTASLLMGGKWIIDAKTTKTLIMIHEAWKHDDKDKVNKILSQFKK